jgi:small subunit ribosomal protein S20
VRKTARRRAINVNRLSRVKTFIKSFEKVISAKGSVKDIMTAFSAMQKEILRGVSKRVIHKNAAARKISRMYSKIRGIIGEGTPIKSQ